MSTQEINEELVCQLDKYPQLLACHTVVLEHQPSKNPKMKNLSNMLYSYFVIRGIVDAQPKVMRKILFISPRNKLSIYDGPDIKCNLKGQYARNKFYGKHYCEWLIRMDHPRLDYFQSHRKKDDLADCFLQGAWYLLSKSGDIPKEVNLTAVYDQNRLRYAQVKSRRPTSKQIAQGKYSLNTIKYYVKNMGLETQEKLLGFVQEDPNFGKSLEFYFGSVLEFMRCVTLI